MCRHHSKTVYYAT